tara:strand:- start:1138 stop:1560 length:423 start_codon:yes stop_codon:yes gene_type:complete
MDLYNLLNVDKQSKTESSKQVTTLEGTIKKRINEVIHETLVKEFPKYYKNIDTTTIVKATNGELSKLSDISGYRLLIPIDEKVDIKNDGKSVTFNNAVKVANPQIYLQGIKNNLCEYVKIGGKTTIWNKKQSNFVDHKTK